MNLFPLLGCACDAAASSPFGMNGWEAMVTTAVVCGTVIACMVIGGKVTVQATQLICEACKDFSNAVTDAIVAAFTGKLK